MPKKSRLEHWRDQLCQIKNSLPKISNWRALFILLDIKLWQKRKKLLWSEYFLFHFYKKNQLERNAYVLDNEVMFKLPALFNDHKGVEILNEKSKFNDYFKNYIGREYVILKGSQFSEFCEFVKKHNKVIVKPLDQMGGKGIQLIELGSNLQDEFMNVTKQHPVLVEEVLSQNEAMKSLNPDSVNTIRIVTMQNQDGIIEAPLANIRIGRKGSCVDNFCAGGMTASIDVSTGIVSSKAFDKDSNSFEYHPDSGVKIKGFKIPEWSNVVDCAKNAASKLPQCRYIGWDIMIRNDNRICLIEGNSRPEARIFQIPAGKGLREVYRKFLGNF